MNPFQYTSSSIHPASQAQVFGRLGQIISDFFQRTAIRFKKAADSFHHAYDAEVRFAELERNLSIANHPRDSVRLAGYLFSQTSNKCIALYEGSNTFIISNERMARMSVLPNASHTASDADCDLRIKGDDLEVEALNDLGVKQHFHTNDLITLGNLRFLLKLIPEPYRHLVTPQPGQMEEIK